MTDNIPNEDLFNDLFAHRIQYMDFITDEYAIIRRLKLKLHELGHNNNIDNLLYSFYCYFDIPITFSEIENVQININTSNVIYINLANINHHQENIDDNHQEDNNQENIDDNHQEYNNQENIDDNHQENPDEMYMPPLVDVSLSYGLLLPQFFNILMGMNITTVNFDQVLISPNGLNPGLSDVVVTIDENSLNNIPILKITNNINEKCTICMNEMILDEEYLDIECKHIFHKECLETYLKNYNHICPVCRKEIGVSHPNI
jgi:E3 ubiquitin-protein ligase RHA2